MHGYLALGNVWIRGEQTSKFCCHPLGQGKRGGSQRWALGAVYSGAGLASFGFERLIARGVESGPCQGSNNGMALAREVLCEAVEE